MRPPRILIATAAVGCGHTRAALAIREALLAQRPDAHIDFVETLDHASGWFVRPYRDGYLAAIARAPRVAGWIYRATDRAPTRAGSAIGRAVELRGLRRFATLPALLDADAVVTTHFLCARILGGLKTAGDITAPVAVCVTDVHPHGVWLGGGKGVDALMVADDDSRIAAQRGTSGRIHVTGIPIDQRFESIPTPAAARTTLGLPQSRPIVLVAGGGLGLGGLEHVVRELMNASAPLHVAVICGRNAQLKAELAPLAREWRTAAHDQPSCSVEGFTNQMPIWMAAADIMVGKPGGLTTAEACAAGLPMILLKPLPGQEERNASHLCGRNAAVLQPDPILAAREAIALTADTSRREAMAHAAAHLGRPGAAHAAASIVLKLIDPARLQRPAPARSHNADEHALAALPCVAG